MVSQFGQYRHHSDLGLSRPSYHMSGPKRHPVHDLSQAAENPIFVALGVSFGRSLVERTDYTARDLMFESSPLPRD